MFSPSAANIASRLDLSVRFSRARCSGSRVVANRWTVSAPNCVTPREPLIGMTVSSSSSDAARYPIRMPGTTILLKEPVWTASPESSSDDTASTGSPSNLNSAIPSSSRIGAPWRAAISTTSRLRSIGIVHAWGFWNVGIRYMNLTRLPSAAAPLRVSSSVSGSIPSASLGTPRTSAPKRRSDHRVPP